MKLYSTVDKRRNSKIVAMPKLRSYLRRKITHTKGMLILDSHIPGVAPRELTRQVFVLRCDPKALQSRLRRRGWRWEKVRENVLAEILDSCLIEAIEEYGSSNVRQLITSRLNLLDSIKIAKLILCRKRVRKATVNWLAQLHNESELRGYLK